MKPTDKRKPCVWVVEKRERGSDWWQPLEMFLVRHHARNGAFSKRMYYLQSRLKSDTPIIRVSKYVRAR